MSPDPFATWWQAAGKAIYGQTFRYSAPLYALDEAFRRELTEHAVRKTQLLARELHRRGQFRSEAGLTRWGIDRARREFRRQLPLVPRMNGWLWRLPADQRRILLLEYQPCGPAEIAYVLGVPLAQAEQQLGAARAALRALIRADGFDPDAWLGIQP
jgi:hypothetical protein